MNITDLTTVVPSPRQLAWQQTQYYGFIHFGINTMTDREWGFGNEPTTLFDPQKLDADKWVQQMKVGQMQGVILTCKHHDGFCLWPSTTTDYSVKTAPWKAGEGDLVKEVSQACQKYGLKRSHCIITMSNNGILGERAQALVISASLNDRL